MTVESGYGRDGGGATFEWQMQADTFKPCAVMIGSIAANGVKECCVGLESPDHVVRYDFRHPSMRQGLDGYLQPKRLATMYLSARVQVPINLAPSLAFLHNEICADLYN